MKTIETIKQDIEVIKAQLASKGIKAAQINQLWKELNEHLKEIKRLSK